MTAQQIKVDIMTRAQWKQVDQLFHEALECPPERRGDFLKQTCNGDHSLFREVESLLSSHQQAGGFIEKSPSDIAAQFLADEKVFGRGSWNREGTLLFVPDTGKGPYSLLRQVAPRFPF